MAEQPDNFWKTQREKIKKSARDIAGEVRCTHPLVLGWEKDETIPNIAWSGRLAVAYKVPEKRIIDEIVAMTKRLNPQSA